MKSTKRILALLLAAVLCMGILAACGEKSDDKTATSDEKSGSDTPLVVGYSPFSGKFSPFFSETAYDQDVWAMTQINLLTSDRTGAVIEKGINGTTVAYNGTDYTYYGPADVEITMNDDGTVDYSFKLREDLTFSDGEKITIDDVIFTMYVYSDPSYDGSTTFFALPIKGMDEYRSGWATLNNLLFDAGKDNADFSLWTEEQQTEFWTKYDAATKGLAEEIVAYCVANGYAPEGDIAAAAGAWGFEVAEGGSIEDFAAALSEAYGADVANMINTENAGSSVEDLFPGYDAFSATAVQTGESAASIAGIVKTGDYSMTVTTTQVDATAIYQFTMPIAPLHYYGDTAKYNYDANQFGFDKGDLAVAREKISEPMGAGAYKFNKFEDGVVYFEANESYFKGAPKTKYVNFKQCLSDDDKLNGVTTGTIDITDPSFSTDTVNAIKKANSNGEVSGDKIETNTVDNLGYGYIGMCSKVMNVNGEPASDASKALRKAFGTIFSVYREVAIDSYYGDRAAVINYPISNTSWAAPQSTDDGYKVAFSVDKDGNDIYTSDMSAEDKYAAAKAAALGFFEAAGYTVADGKVTAAPAGAKMEYTAWIPADGSGDHPSFMILTEASKALADIGIKLEIKDLTNSSDLWTALEAQEVAIWCAAWGASVDPDMYQIYFSGDEATGKAAGGSNYMYAIDDKELNQLILDGRSSIDQAYRKGIYKACLDIVIDWAVEIPVYQRQNAIIFSAERVDLTTVTPDITTFYTWLQEIENTVLK